MGFPDLAQAHLEDMLPFADPSEELYTADWSGLVSAGWRLEEESSMFRMVWDADAVPPNSDFEPIRLGPEHAARALALAELTQPGPFGLRTVELGDYFGVFEGSRLIAMAGERMRAGPFCEISGVCVDPAFQGQGHARRLMEHLLKRQLRRGAIPFLHAMRANDITCSFYQRLGFRIFKETVVRVVALS